MDRSEQRRQVIVVDPYDGSAAGLQMMLEEDWEVVTFNTGQEAMRAIRSRVYFDALIAAADTPGVSGVELCSAALASAIPKIVILTTTVITRELEEYSAQTGVPILQKPFRSSELRALLELPSP